MSKKLEIDSERSRVRAALVNSGIYGFFEADKKIEESNVLITMAKEVSQTPAGQASFLSAVATAARSFGAVTVEGDIDVPLRIPFPRGGVSIGEVAISLGASRTSDIPFTRAISIGPQSETHLAWSVRAYWNGWIAGAISGRSKMPIGRADSVLAGVASGAIAVGQAFLAELGDLRAGRVDQLISLWNPHMTTNGLDDPGPEQRDCFLPLQYWLIGLGNLGQAYLWSLSMLPYPKPADVLLFLQDDDHTKKENWGTSILVEKGKYGKLKTRIAEEWADLRSFQVRRIDRRLGSDLRRTEFEPAIALSGLDRMPPRRLLGLPGFAYVIDAGLGATAAEYPKIRVNVFDSIADPAKHFHGVEDKTAETVNELMQLPAYQDLAQSHIDGQCGAALVAESSVAVPFVSALAGAIVITQAIRIASGVEFHSAVTGLATDLRNFRATLGTKSTRISFPIVQAEV